MNIYKAEQAIASKIKNNKILCHAKASKLTVGAPEFSQIQKAMAGEQFAFADINDNDLYFHQSILVSTNWNANDELFLPEQVWNARQTPNHKPTNFNHNSTKIVGHIVGNYAINDAGELIDDDTAVDDLPNKFHILTSAVIYKIWHSDEEYEAQVAELIQDIENDEMYVSMECIFPNFSYALADEDGNIKIISRNKDTAFLSEHLRAYGGTGYYDDFKIGRVPENIRFIGKGYTKNPANKESIVFSKDNIFSFNSISFQEKFEKSEKNGVLLNSKQISNGDLLMSDTNTKNEDLVSLNKDLQTQVDELKNQLAQAGIQKFEEQLNALSDQKKVLTAKLESHAQDIQNLTQSLQDKETALNEALTQNKVLEDELNTIKAEAVQANRQAKIEALGYDKDFAKQKVAIFAGLSDEIFDAVVVEMKPCDTNNAKKPKNMSENKTTAEDDVDPVGEANASDTNVDDLTSDDNVTSVASQINDDNDDNDAGTISLAEAMTKYMEKK